MNPFGWPGFRETQRQAALVQAAYENYRRFRCYQDLVPESLEVLCEEARRDPGRTLQGVILRKMTARP